MKTYMPLHWFVYPYETEYRFSGGIFSISRFTASEKMTASGYFSNSNRKKIQMADWALTAESGAHEIEADSNLIIVAFWLMSEGTSPYIQFRLQEDGLAYSLMYDMFQPNLVGDPPLQEYHLEDLERVNAAYEALKLTDHQNALSRSHNAIYFLYLATHTVHWISSFTFLMNSLEALFGNDYSPSRIPGQKGVTETIKTRVSNFIGDTSLCTKEDIADLYNTRSRIAHGDIRASKKPEENLSQLKRLETITKLCFRKMVQGRAFTHFADKNSRDAFVATLD